jgi:PAS domain S-box-containing protein
MHSLLYVDDEPALLEIGRIFLEKTKEFTVRTFTSVAEALDFLAIERVDAIVSDYQMPDMDGIAFLKALRERDDATPFIIYTGKGREEVVIEALNAGADFYLQKGGDPIPQFAELVHKVKRAVEQRRSDEALVASEKKYRHLIENSSEAIVVAQDGMLRLVNHRTVEFTGYLEDELLSMPFSAVIHPDDRAMVVERYQKRLIGEELPTRYIFRLGPKDASTRWVEISVAMIEWDGRPATLNFLTDITKRKQAEDALRIQHDLNRVLTHSTSLTDAFNQILLAALQIKGLDVGGIYMVDPVTGALNIIAHHGLSPDFIAHTSHFDASSPQVQRARTGIPFFGRYSEIRQPGKDSIRDNEQVTALASIPVMHEGELISILNLASRTVDEIPVSTRHTLETLAMQAGGALVRIRSRKALEESEARYRNVVEDQTELICRFLPDGTHVFVNEAYCRYFGVNREKIIGTRFRPRIPPEDRENVARLIASLTPEHPLETIDQRIIMPDGSIRWQRWVDRAIFRADCSLKEYQSVGRDITDWKLADEALAENEERLHLAIDGANLGIWDMNLITGEMVHNQRWADMLGFSRDELDKPREWWGQRVHPDDYQNVLRLSDLHHAGKVPFFDAVYRMKHKNGEWRWVHSQGKIISRDSTGAPLRLIGINQDITDQKVAEQDILRKNEELAATSEELHQIIDKLTQSERNLRESEEKYRTFFENTGTATVVAEEDNIISLANAEFAKLSGYSKEDIEGKKCWTEFVVKEDLERMLAQHRLRRQDREEALTQYEFRFVTKSGDIRTIYLSIDLIPGTKKSVASLLDITERKSAEELYHMIFENMGTAMIILEEDTTISHVNEEMENIWGYSREEIEGKVKWPKMIADQDLDKMLEYHRLRRTDPDSAPKNYEFRFVHKNGGLRDAALTAAMIPGTKRSVISLRDITEIKVTEHALQESERRLNFAIEGAHLGLWDLNVVTHEVIHNRKWTEMLGFSSAEMDKPSNWWQERVHPDDVASVYLSNDDHFAGITPSFDCIYRMKHKNGDWVWVHTQGKIISRDSTGDPLRMIGINQDITDRVKAEEALIQANLKLNLLYGITRHDINNQLTVQLGYLEMLKDSKIDPSQNEYFHKAITAAQRISAMIRFTKEYESIGVNAPFWQECRTLVDTMAKEVLLGQVTLKNDLPAGAEVFADPLIAKVIYNLIDNAVRYGGKITAIRFFGEESGEDSIIVCEDDGVGIPPGEKEKIFERGFGKNTGLGLAISLEILAITGIKIIETGKPGKGARFEMAVPKGSWRFGKEPE